MLCVGKYITLESDSDLKIIGITTCLFQNFSQKKKLLKILAEVGKQEILQQMFRKF